MEIETTIERIYDISSNLGALARTCRQCGVRKAIITKGQYHYLVCNGTHGKPERQQMYRAGFKKIRV